MSAVLLRAVKSTDELPVEYDRKTLIPPGAVRGAFQWA
jgi:hypothetical protein